MTRWFYLSSLAVAVGCAIVLALGSTRRSYGSGESAVSTGARGTGTHEVLDAARKGSRSAKRAGKAKLLAEGKRTRSVGSVVRGGRGRIRFRLHNGLEFTLLENSVLERLESHANAAVRIDARVTTYKGKNYLWVMGFEPVAAAGGEEAGK